ncbi:MAG: Lrp/AsnC family transcriptional regulator, partial [Candidatus Micrarchaeota archaeon]
MAGNGGVALDLKDRKILYELDLDSRQSFSRLGKKVRLSKEVVNYRVKRLMELGVIRQFHTVINVGKLGYTSFRLFLRLGGATPEKERGIIEYLLKQKIVIWLVSVEGNWDLVMWCCARDVGELGEFWRELFARYGQFIEDNWLSVWSKVWYFRRAYLLDKKFDNTR